MRTISGLAPDHVIAGILRALSAVQMFHRTCLSP